MINQVIIPIAGKGTRFLPITKSVCKTLLPIVDKPTIHYLVNEAIEAKAEEVIIVMSPEQADVKNYFNINTNYVASLTKEYKEIKEIENILKKIKISYVIQETPKGLGDAIMCAKPLLKNNTFGVILGDDLIKKTMSVYGINELITKYNKIEGLYLGVQEVKIEDTSKYGIIGGTLKKGLIYVNEIVEKPLTNPPSNFACIGRYLLPYKIFDYLEKTMPGVNKEIQLTDAIEAYRQEYDNVFAVKIRGKRFDIGSKVGYLKANIDYSMSREDLKEDINDYLREVIDG